MKRCGDAGWLHPLQENVHNVPNMHRRWSIAQNGQGLPPQDLASLCQQSQRQLDPSLLRRLSGWLGVSEQSLQRLEIGWDGRAFTFPMSDEFGRVVGIRLRWPDGHKTCITGSRTGLFTPTGLSTTGSLLILEGESDTAAALTLGLNVIGRAGCGQSVKMVCRYCHGRDGVVVFGDNDGPGRRGAQHLAHALALYCGSVRMAFPPDGTKDLRAWLQTGLGRAEFLEFLQRNAVVVQVRVCAVMGRKNHG